MTNDTTHELIFELIREERKFQDKKWGIKKHHDLKWNAIMLEECGEVSKSLIEGGSKEDLIKEIVQVATVAVAWLQINYGEKIKRGK